MKRGTVDETAGESPFSPANFTRLNTMKLFKPLAMQRVNFVRPTAEHDINAEDSPAKPKLVSKKIPDIIHKVF